MESHLKIGDADVVIPKESVRQVQQQFTNVLFGYFLGNRLPFPVVEYYAKNTWAKYGFIKLMMNSSGFFFFKFDSQKGMDTLLEEGPWCIRGIPIFLNIWSPNAALKKEEIKSVPVWVKFHNVPITVYTDDGLSMLASEIGEPKRLDTYTADMCVHHWGRNAYARALIEIKADAPIKDYVKVAIPKMVEEEYFMEKIQVEYEWKPMRCDTCCVFGHEDINCPKAAKEKREEVEEDDFQKVKNKNKAKKMTLPKKIPITIFRQKMKTGNNEPSTSGTKKDGNTIIKPQEVKQPKKTKSGEDKEQRKTKEVIKFKYGQTKDDNFNRFGPLQNKENDEAEDVEELEITSSVVPYKGKHETDDDFEELQNEISKYKVNDNLDQNKSEGASTPDNSGLNE